MLECFLHGAAAKSPSFVIPCVNKETIKDNSIVTDSLYINYCSRAPQIPYCNKWLKWKISGGETIYLGLGPFVVVGSPTNRFCSHVAPQYSSLHLDPLL